MGSLHSPVTPVNKLSATVQKLLTWQLHHTSAVQSQPNCSNTPAYLDVSCIVALCSRDKCKLRMWLCMYMLFRSVDGKVRRYDIRAGKLICDTIGRELCSCNLCGGGGEVELGHVEVLGLFTPAMHAVSIA